jgi:hypothetical protein
VSDERDTEQDDALTVGGAAPPTGLHDGDGDEKRAERWSTWLDGDGDDRPPS